MNDINLRDVFVAVILIGLMLLSLACVSGLINNDSEGILIKIEMQNLNKEQ